MLQENRTGSDGGLICQKDNGELCGKITHLMEIGMPIGSIEYLFAHLINDINTSS